MKSLPPCSDSWHEYAGRREARHAHRGIGARSAHARVCSRSGLSSVPRRRCCAGPRQREESPAPPPGASNADRQPGATRPLKRALAAARQHLETATPNAAALVLSQLTAPARGSAGVEAGDAVTVAARAARLHL